MVVRVHPHAWRWRAGAAAGALSVTLLLGYLWGASSGSEMPFFDNPEEKLRDQVAQLSVERDADQQALRDLRASLSDQATQLNEMREMLALYRGVMMPDDSEEVVVLRPPRSNMTPSTTVCGWSHSFTAAQVITRDTRAISPF